jgi:type IV pilus assembly protein PilW
MNSSSFKQSGFTLIELMIAMLLGLFLTGALLTMLAQARQSFQQDENFARMQDESRYAMHEITNDVSMAGFVGDITVLEQVDLDATLVIDEDCEDSAGESFAFNLFHSTAGFDTSLMALDNITTADAAAKFGCLDEAELVEGTDIVAVKKLEGATTTSLANGDVALRYNGTVGALFVHPIAGAVPTPFEDRIYSPAIYFIRNYTNTEGDGLPALCRKVLKGGAKVVMETECIAEGVENLQVEYGIDSDLDGSVDELLTAPTQEQLGNAISARIILLARTSEADRSYTDNRTYSLSNADDFAPDDSFRRRVYTTTVPVQNIRNRNLITAAYN